MLDPDREDGEPLPTKDSENLDKAFGPDGHFVSCGGNAGGNGGGEASRLIRRRTACGDGVMVDTATWEPKGRGYRKLPSPLYGDVPEWLNGSALVGKHGNRVD